MLKVKVGKSKNIRCARYVNGSRMYVRLNDKSLEQMDCFKYMGTQVEADGGCERDVVNRMNEGYKECGALKILLSNRGYREVL